MRDLFGERTLALLGLNNLLVYSKLYGAFAILYFSEVTGTYTGGMIVYAAIRLSVVVFEVPTGVMSDLIGRVRTLQIGTLAMFVAILCYALAGSMVLLLAGAVLEGAARALFSGNNSALLFETLKARGQVGRFHHYFGYLETLSHIGMGIGALVGGVLADMSLRIVVVASLLPAFAALLLVLPLRESAQRIRSEGSSLRLHMDAWRAVLSDRRLRLFTLAQAVATGFDEAVWNFRSAYLASVWPVWAVGLLNALDHIGAMAGSYLSGPVIDRFRHSAVLQWYQWIDFVSYAVAVGLRTAWSPLIMVAPSFLYSVCETAREQLVQDHFSDQQRATMGSILSVAKNIGYAFASLLIGIVADHVSVGAALLVGSTVPLFVLPLYRAYFR